MVVRTPSWGARHAFPDMLVPSSRVAIEYDSPGARGGAHGEFSVDPEKDAALRSVGCRCVSAYV